MKKIIAMLLVVVMLCTVCAGCATATVAEDGTIGYVIVPHSDGDEHIAITNYWTGNGVIHVDTVDDRHIAACVLIVVTNN